MSDKLSQILFLSGVRGDTRRYRTFHPYEQLRMAGIPCALSHVTDSHLPALVAQSNVVVFHRVIYNEYIQKQLDVIQTQGSISIVDADDLVFDPQAFQWIDSPDFQDPIRARLYREEMNLYRKMVESCQAAIVSTEYLAGQIQALGKPTWIHRNAYSAEMLALSEAAYGMRQNHEGRIILGYASGTPTHDRDFALISPAIQLILERHPQVQLWLVGPISLGTEWQSYSPRIRRIPLVPWRQLPQILVQFDINLAPLVADNPFSQSKSEIKWMEAGLVRVPTIASPTEAFCHAIRSGENGCLAGSMSEWEEAIENLIQNPSQRTNLAENAYQDILRQYNPRVRSLELINTLNQTLQSLNDAPVGKVSLSRSNNAEAIESLSPGILSPELEEHPTLTEMGLYTLRTRGLLTLLKQEWIYFRRYLARFVPYRTTKSIQTNNSNNPGRRGN